MNCSFRKTGKWEYQKVASCLCHQQIKQPSDIRTGQWNRSAQQQGSGVNIWEMSLHIKCSRRSCEGRYLVGLTAERDAWWDQSWDEVAAARSWWRAHTSSPLIQGANKTMSEAKLWWSAQNKTGFCFVLFLSKVTFVLLIMLFPLYKLNNNSHRLFVAPHLIRAQSAYKDIRIHSFHHMHTHQDTPAHTNTHLRTHIHTHTHTTNTCITGDGLVKWRYAEEKRWLFSFDLKEESEDECLTERGSEFQSTGPMYWKDLSPRVLLPILGTRKMRVSAAEWRQQDCGWLVAYAPSLSLGPVFLLLFFLYLLCTRVYFIFLKYKSKVRGDFWHDFR